MKTKFYWKTTFAILVGAILLNLYVSLSSKAATSYIIKKPTWKLNTFNCQNPQPEAGVVPKENLVSYTCDNMITKDADKDLITTLPEMQEAVCRIGQEARNLGYQIFVNESYRPYKTQVTLWCKCLKIVNKDTKKTRTPKECVSVSAVPGTSNHGKGRGLDIALRKNNILLTAKGNSTAQCSNTKGATDEYKKCKKTAGSTECLTNKDYAKILAEIVYRADPKFFRLSTEIWHFDYFDVGTQSKDNGKFTDIPISCFPKKKK